jgi:multidrug efflux pump
MNFSAPFIARPIATILLAIGLMISGSVAYLFLPVASLPNIDVPVVVVIANRPGADPATMASSVAAPLERRLGEIPGLNQLASINAQNSTTIIVFFDFSRNLDDAAREVQAAINAAQPDLPSGLPIRPFYRKVNTADTPIMTLALTSDVLSLGQVYDAADTVLSQRLSQLPGVSRVQIDGGQTPAIRIQLDPGALRAAGISADDVRQAIVNANVMQPVGDFQGRQRSEQIEVNGQIDKAADYGKLVLKASNGAVLRLSDVAHVTNGVNNQHLAAWHNHKRAILLKIFKIPGANIIKTVAGINANLPVMKSWMSPDIQTTVFDDRTYTIKSSTNEVQLTLLITGVLVLLTVMIFLRRLAATVAAAVTVPLSLAGTFACMWAMGFSLNNYSLMAITIAVGFVVDDAIVMIENIARLREQGMPLIQAAITGSRQIGFTVISISLSLVAVFIPLLFMGGILGSIFHEFAFTLTAAIAVSAVVSLTVTPMVCARMVDRPFTGWLARLDTAVDGWFRKVLRGYAKTLDWALHRRWLMLGTTFATIILTFVLYGAVPKGFLSEQDTGLLRGTTTGAASISFTEMANLQQKVADVILSDPGVLGVASNVGASGSPDAQQNTGTIWVELKPRNQRNASAAGIIARLRPKLATVPGLRTTLFAMGDLGGGGNAGGGAQYDFDVLDDNLDELRLWTSRIEARLRQEPGFVDVQSDQDVGAPQINLTIDRAAAARMQVSVSDIDTALGNALGQRQISRIYEARNQYEVVLETLPWLQSDPHYLDHIYVGSTTTGAQVPLGSVTRASYGIVPLNVEHDSGRTNATVSFNLKAGTPSADALTRAKKAAESLNLPPSVHIDFQGNNKLILDSLATEPFLIAAALLSIYIVLGVLYESLIHPLTILSTLPSAGLGALLAVLVTGTQFGVLSIIGIVLLMGIVKKNAIMLVDFALEAERERGMSPEAAIYEACIERFRPIIMTTLTALCGALPLALALGSGSETRRPLGIAIVGGLIVSQALTLYTTPVIYLALERRARRKRGQRARIVHAPAA